MVRKYWAQITLFIALIILAATCRSNKRTEDIETDYKNKVAVKEAKAAKHIAIAKNLEKDVEKFQDTIKAIREGQARTEIQILGLRKQVATSASKAASYQSGDLQAYWVDRYHVKPISVPITPFGCVVNDSLGRLIVTDLIHGDGYKAEIKLTKSLLADERRVNSQNDSITSNQEKQILSLYSAIEEKDGVNELSKKEVVKTQASLRVQEKKTAFWKYWAIGTTIISTTLLIKK